MLDEVLRRLKVQKYAQPGRDNRCICPCHQDRTGSLMVKLESDGRILMCCQAGCSTQAICEQIGIKVSDLNERPLVPGAKVYPAKPAAKKPTKPAPAPTPAEEKEGKPERPLPWPPTKVYDYTDRA